MPKVSVIIQVRESGDYKKSLDSVLNQTLDDIEVFIIDDHDLVGDSDVEIIKTENILDKISGEYVFFMCSGDEIDNTTFKECYEVSKQKKLDFLVLADDIVFYRCGDDVYNFESLKSKTFNIDINESNRFYRTDFIKGIDDLEFNQYLFFWSCVFNAERFSFINKTLTSSNGEKIVEKFNVSNLVFQKFKDYGYLEQFKFLLYDWKMEFSYENYQRLEESQKENYYKELKADYTKMVYNWKFPDFASYLIPVNKLFFDNVVYSKDFNEFEDSLDIFYLELDSYHVELDNERIKKQIDFVKKDNQRILNSRSWKMTKPLRGLK